VTNLDFAFRDEVDEEKRGGGLVEKGAEVRIRGTAHTGVKC